jgi:predicted heme/steroid binding protein
MRFCFEFDLAGMSWMLAGCNTEQRCLIALDGVVYDVTKFVDVHPGSKETLLDHAGGDVTTLFNDVGHSQMGRAMLESLYVCGQNTPLHTLRRKQTVLHAVRNRECSAVAKALQKAMVVKGRKACRTDNRRLCVRIHEGQPRPLFDPVDCKWQVWWSCCGQLHDVQIPLS